MSRFFFTVCLLVLYSGQAASQQAIAYPTSREGSKLIINVPSIKIGDNSFGNVRFNLLDNNTLVIDRFTQLDEQEQDALAFFESTACSPAGNLEKVAAYLAYLDEAGTYCLQAQKGNTVEGGKVFTYLIIRNQSVQHVGDVRLDGYAKCCFQFLDQPGTMQLGVYDNGVFVEVDITDTLDLTLDYVIRVPDADGYNFEF